MSFGKWIIKGAFHFLWLVPVLALLNGAYSDAVAWRDHRVTIQIAKDIEVKNIASSLTHEDFRQINCLAVNMYFEARNQGDTGMAAVGDVVFNRLKSGVFPDRICQVIYQGTVDESGKPILNKCQFSWYCDGTKHVISDRKMYGRALEVAYNQYLYREKMPDITGGATYYHTDYVDPHKGVWKNAKPVKQIGAHIFYKPSQTISNASGEEKPKTHVDKMVTLR